MKEESVSSQEAPASGDAIRNALNSWQLYLARKDSQISSKVVSWRYYSAPELIDLNRLVNTLAGEFFIEGVSDLKVPVPFAEARLTNSRATLHNPYDSLTAAIAKLGIKPEYFLMHVGFDRSLNGNGTYDLFIISEKDKLLAFSIQQQINIHDLPPRLIRFGPGRNLKGNLAQSTSSHNEIIAPSTNGQILTLAKVLTGAIKQLDEKQTQDQEAQNQSSATAGGSST